MSARLEAYLSRLARELREHGLDRRILEEAREHLVDAIEEGLRRGLSVDAAEGEAFVRFGPPETVAAHFATERSRMVNRILVTLTRIARLIAEAILAVVMTTVRRSITTMWRARPAITSVFD